MERGRYNAGNSQMGKGCITYGASKKRSLLREQVTRLCHLLSFVKGDSMIPSSLFVILKYIEAPWLPTPPNAPPFRSSSIVADPSSALRAAQKCQLRSLFVHRAEGSTDLSRPLGIFPVPLPPRWLETGRDEYRVYRCERPICIFSSYFIQRHRPRPFARSLARVSPTAIWTSFDGTGLERGRGSVTV